MRHIGAGMSIVPELLVREVLLIGLHELASDEERIDLMVSRVDSLLQGSQELWEGDMKATLVDFIGATTDDAARILNGYPQSSARFPMISVVIDSGSENESLAVAADLQGSRTEQVGTAVPGDPTSLASYRVETIGTEWTTTLQIGSWTLSPEASILLHEVVKAIMFRNKGRLLAAGVRDVRLSESGFAPSPEMYPNTGFVPLVTCAMEWTWRQERRTEQVAHTATVATGRILS